MWCFGVGCGFNGLLWRALQLSVLRVAIRFHGDYANAGSRCGVPYMTPVIWQSMLRSWNYRFAFYKVGTWTKFDPCLD